MNPVVGLDISKGESQVQAFLDKSKPFGKSFKVSHTVEGLSYLVSFLEGVKKESGKKPSIILEATGHYQTPVVHYLEERGYLMIIINPLISYKARGSSLLCKSRSIRWAKESAIKLKAAAARNPFEKTVYQSHILSLGMYINMILQYKEHLSKLESEIDALAKEIEESNIIKSIPGIGEKIAATIISEIGEIDRFTDPKKLVGFAGVDPSVFESGKFTATKNRITKRGSSRLRHALYMAVRCAIRDCRKKKTTEEIIPRNKKMREFYDKKRGEGKPFKVAVIACVNKLLHWIFALLKNRTTFQDIA
ncbi:IS110 family transposase [Neobacillus niacini]|uniref:IS110 family transposase n=2 Tax=Neobacillus niacini TaxID=86668 RepID=UPI002DB99B2E|nr:IS110 family transposase [Neobacillus niacini]MEC1523919.1 IS110 family transposase [Neobacillus niacini]